MPYTHDLHFIDIRRIHFFPSSLILLASVLFHNRNNDLVQNNMKFEYFDLGAHLPSAKIIMDLFLCCYIFCCKSVHLSSHTHSSVHIVSVNIVQFMHWYMSQQNIAGVSSLVVYCYCM